MGIRTVPSSLDETSSLLVNTDRQVNDGVLLSIERNTSLTQRDLVAIYNSLGKSSQSGQ